MNIVFDRILPALSAGQGRHVPLRPSAMIGIESSHIGDSRELPDLPRLDIGGVSCLNMPGVERIILEGTTDPMKAEPSPGFGRAVPFYPPASRMICSPNALRINS
ncbi:hypothetical protein MOV66_14000 [Agrobacterium sp. SHOUNA12C]|uniref:hypothetical protein n=1 Tax=Rhizobium rhizogenes TaxID=359 RepID=UPI0005A795D9|nr:hypothetical protein [Rhizobium rhizogenes]KAA6490976.1 hypothetical protein DXT98_02145 [Agrobacterium sp. ICMP 7243]MCJ9722691.1 hypothetical protein [Agrobacterium sp. BETTINA12B]MCJ9757759.1 hypothetical protein [Agrobacterium sp. SHOUNA12C]NTF48127.1 hypothetical protein [Rhizobium rhizogenes]NTF54678.1 hypothetical protein [Rhizobium rhizogenes]